MSFTRVTPKKSPSKRQNLTTGCNFPLRTRLVVKSHYQNDLALESGRETADTSQYQHHLNVDGLCQNTVENLGNSTVEEEKMEGRQCRVLSCSAVLMFVVFVVSLISLVLTLLMLTGNVNPRCSCASNKDRSKPIRTTDFSLSQGKQEAKTDFQKWLIDVLRNITEKMDYQSGDFHKLKVDFNMMNKNREKNEKKLQESVNETKNELDSKIRMMKAAITHMNTTSVEMNEAIDKLRQDLGDTEKRLKFKTLDVSVLYENLTRLQNESKQDYKTNYIQIQKKLEKMNSKVYKLQTKLNVTIKAFHETTTRQKEQLEEVNKTTNYKLNLTKDEINSSLGEISSDLLEMKTHLTQQVNDTKRSIEASRSMLHNSIKDLNETLLNKIKNMTKSPINPITGYIGSSGLSGVKGPPANFSQCQYKVLASQGIANDGSGGAIEVDVSLLEPKGKRIVGSTCSTNGAAEYNFGKLNSTGNILYRCICKGVSTLFTPTGNKIYCYMHYWECPFGD